VIIIFISILPLIPNIIPHLTYSPLVPPDPPVLEGKLEVNNLLNGAHRTFEGEIKGPEAFAILNGELYTTLHGGFVAKISKTIEPVVKFGQSCGEFMLLMFSLVNGTH